MASQTQLLDRKGLSCHPKKPLCHFHGKNLESPKQALFDCISSYCTRPGSSPAQEVVHLGQVEYMKIVGFFCKYIGVSSINVLPEIQKVTPLREPTMTTTTSIFARNCQIQKCSGRLPETNDPLQLTIGLFHLEPFIEMYLRLFRLRQSYLYSQAYFPSTFFCALWGACDF